jgi:hypothetical protein
MRRDVVKFAREKCEIFDVRHLGLPMPRQKNSA